MIVSTSKDEMSFGCPTIGPKVYIVKGPSGWTETLDRKQADAELVAFLGKAPLDSMLELFVTQREINQTPTDWYTITGFLGRMSGATPKDVPHAVAIAFWGRVVIMLASRGAN